MCPRGGHRSSESPPPVRRPRTAPLRAPSPIHRRNNPTPQSASPPPQPRSRATQSTEELPTKRTRRGQAVNSRRNLQQGGQKPPSTSQQSNHSDGSDGEESSTNTLQRSLRAPAIARVAPAPIPPSSDSTSSSDSQTDNEGDNREYRYRGQDLGSGSEDEAEMEDWEMYSAGLERGEGMIVRVWQGIWVVQMWKRFGNSFTNKYYHLYQIDESFTCDCPISSPCTHTEYFTHKRLQLSSTAPIANTPTPAQAICFLLDRIDLAAFSVQQSPGDYDSGKRVVVRLTHENTWSCGGGCRGRGDCNHIAQSRVQAVKLGLIDEGGEILQDDMRRTYGEREAMRQERAVVAGASSSTSISISNLSRGPTLALRLANPADQAFPIIRSGPKELFSKQLKLDHGARCRCGKLWSSLTQAETDQNPPRFQPFTIHTETGAVQVEIETVKCPVCVSGHRRIGPDLLEHGLFNFNNSIGFSRELFDLFTLELTQSETPFVAFFRTMTFHYRNHGSSFPFVSASTFARAFFTFSDLHHLDVPLRCPICGDEAETVICDGSVMGIEQSRLSGNTRPPTLPTSSAQEYSKVVAVPLAPLTPGSLCLTPSECKTLKKEMKKWLDTPSGSVVSVHKALHRYLKALYGREEIADPSRIGPSPFALGKEIAKTCDFLNRQPKGSTRNTLKRFLKQVFADEMIFQAFPPRAFVDLDNFGDHKVVSNTLQKECPVFDGIEKMGEIPTCLARLVKLLTFRSRVVLEELKTNAATSQPISDPLLALAVGRESQHPDMNNWRVTGSKRLLNQFVGDRGSGDCTKHYNLYGKKLGLIGGLAGFWCPHGVCIGAHIMPTSEGRDDFFAGLYCHREKAPKSVVYDYSCALGPYCMVRAPSFFENTRFYIDELHARGHSTCTDASWIAPAMPYNSDLFEANSSAAECAHATIGRIRKSLSYSNEKNGTVLLWIAISVWNRRKLILIGEDKWDSNVVDYAFD
ncbi:hypothetical protein JCM5353_003309 [Sporobolomyces roseus]